MAYLIAIGGIVVILTIGSILNWLMERKIK